MKPNRKKARELSDLKAKGLPGKASKKVKGGALAPYSVKSSGRKQGANNGT
jgi:hypothetical protein